MRDSVVDSVFKDNRTVPGPSFGREPGTDPRDRLPEPRFPRTRYEEESHRWRRRVRGLAFLTLLAAIGVGVWLGYPTLKEYSKAFVDLPALQSSLSVVGLRIGQAETKLQNSLEAQESTRERFNRLEAGLDKRLQAVRRRAQELTDNLYQRVRLEWEARAQKLETRLAGLEQERDADKARLAALQDELSQVRRDMSRHDAELIISRELVQTNHQANNTRMGAIEERIGKGQRDLETLSHGLGKKRIEFELSRKRSQELAPGISLAITKTDPGHRRVSGHISMGAKTVWINNQSANQPVVFYSRTDSKPREIVFTAVAKNSAVGYMLEPVDAKPLVASDATAPTAAE